MSYDYRLLYSEKWVVMCVCRILWRCEIDLLKLKIFLEVFLLVILVRFEVIFMFVMCFFRKVNFSFR